jgi:F-type H+-transporting ATPase subunit b
MTVDWSTVLFQVINFIVLVFLLRRFLYGPIVSIMEKREQEILERETNAQQLSKTAKQTTEEYQHRIETFEHEKEEHLQQMHHEVQQKKQELLLRSKDEISKLQVQWKNDVQHQANHYMIDLREQISKHACSLAKKALSDLADASLESLVLDVFINRLNLLGDQESTKMKQALKQENHGQLKSTFKISSKQSERIEETLHHITNLPITLSYSQDNSLGCGYVLELKGYRMAWNTKHYLDDIEKDILNKLKSLNEDSQNESK